MDTHSKALRQGLSRQEVEESRRRYGSNVLTPVRKTSLWTLFWKKFRDPVIRILMLAWLLSLVVAAVHCWSDEAWRVGPFLESIGIFFAIMLANGVAFVFEVRAKKAFDLLDKVNDDAQVKVMREGNICLVPKREVVVGDIVALETGDEVPADGRLLEAVSLQMDESMLTGEPVTDKTTHEEAFDAEATYPSNKVMRGTTVVDGHGIMEVEKVGDATDYGQVYKDAQVENNTDTPLHIQLKGLAKMISRAGYALAGVTFVMLMVRLLMTSLPLSMDTLNDALKIFMLAVTLIVVSVPEGLPMSVTLSLALSMNRMLKTNNLVRKMHACETMGAATVICTDKTGTLTQNRMQVAHADFYDSKQGALGDNEQSILIKEGIAVNSTAYLDFSGDDIKVVGNPTEGALLLWLHSKGDNYLPLRDNAEIIEQLTFSTERKYMATLVRSPLLGRKVLYVKGAPEIILNMSDGVDNRAALEDLLRTYQQQAMRTLAFAFRFVDDNKPAEKLLHAPLSHLCFLGIVAITDPVRPDVSEAVQTCLHAGIDVKMVTGDTPHTAKAIARQIGLWSDNNSEAPQRLISGSDFAAFTDEQASARIAQLKIMCRARPVDKQRLVQLLQQRGHVVAVTGDGTNDAPALNAAQIGLAMGDGTSVAKQAGDIVILDDSFASIARAVMWGRSLYRNIQRFLLFQLIINVAACLIVLAGAILYPADQAPLTVIQMLWVNLIMDTFAAAAFASLPPNPKVMNDPPRRSGPDGDSIISLSMTRQIFAFATLFATASIALLLYFQADGILSLHKRSLFFTTFVMLQFWNLFNAKAFGDNRSAFAGLRHNKTFLVIAATILVGQYFIVTFGGDLFSVQPLVPRDWLIIIAATSPVLWLPVVFRELGHSRCRRKGDNGRGA